MSYGKMGAQLHEPGAEIHSWDDEEPGIFSSPGAGDYLGLGYKNKEELQMSGEAVETQKYDETVERYQQEFEGAIKNLVGPVEERTMETLTRLPEFVEMCNALLESPLFTRIAYSITETENFYTLKASANEGRVDRGALHQAKSQGKVVAFLLGYLAARKEMQ